MSVMTEVLDNCPNCGDENVDGWDYELTNVEPYLMEFTARCEECDAEWVETFYHNSTRVGDWITEPVDLATVGVWQNLVTGGIRRTTPTVSA